MSIHTEVQRANRAKHEAVEQLLQIRDRIKLHAHLLGMDAQRAYAELDGKVRVLEGHLAREGEHTLESVKKAAHELTRELNDFMTTHVNASVGLLTSVHALMTTRVRTCSSEDSLADAARLMWNDDCGVIPVLASGRVVGVITDRDICMATFTRGKPPADLPVQGAMSRQLISCKPDDSIGAALAIMAEKRVRRLPVLNADGKLVGMLTLADVLRWAGLLTNPAVDAAVTGTLAAICTRTTPDSPRS